jgi:hypothetical protein
MRQEVAMSTTVVPLDELDLDISVAFVALGVARASYDRCPSGENERLVVRAEAEMNRLLDARSAAAA